MTKKNVIEAGFREVPAKPALAKKTVFNLLSELIYELDYIVECYVEREEIHNALWTARSKA